MQAVRNAGARVADFLGVVGQEVERDREVQRVRDEIAANAVAEETSTDWAYAARKDEYAPGTWKCNKFVIDTIEASGATAVAEDANGRALLNTLNQPRPPRAGEWADPSVTIRGWQVVIDPKPGDVAAYSLPVSSGASGHTGIVTSVDARTGAVSVTNAGENSVRTYDFPASDVTYRRYVGAEGPP